MQRRIRQIFADIDVLIFQGCQRNDGFSLANDHVRQLHGIELVPLVDADELGRQRCNLLFNHRLKVRQEIWSKLSARASETRQIIVFEMPTQCQPGKGIDIGHSNHPIAS
ncbi:hypothetical protein AJ88_22110 [Mesorhizobium amorphae CCBAU 01583]|nr:hypothetical protein AJ88_22110 [Mesorhizobium amorphae CCBAU 01583]